MKPDIVIEISFDMTSEATTIRTNAKQEVVQNLIEDYLHSQIGSGKDDSEPAKLDVYHITIGVELGEDSWGSHHDCGNKGLREGILMRVLYLLGNDQSKITYL